MQSDMLLIHKPFLKEMEQFSLAAKRGAVIKSPSAQDAGEDNNFYAEIYAQWLKLTAPRQVNDVRVIPVRGALTYDDPYSVWYGASTISKIEEYIDEALEDESVNSIIIHVHSPGGSAYAVDTVANKIVTGKKKKPIYGYTDSIAASAAVWLFSACTKRFYGSQMAQVGSIGVYAALFNYSGMMDKMGIKVDEYIAGKYKAAGSPYHENTKAEKEIIQDQVDELYTVFVESMATLLGKSVDEVLTFADGRTYTGAKAEKLGLCDEFLTLEGVIDMAGTTTTLAASPGATAEDKATIAKLNANAETTAAALNAANLTLTAANETVAKLTGTVAQLTAQVTELSAKQLEADKKVADAAVAETCVSIYKNSLDRKPTEEELKTFSSYSPEARTAFSAALGVKVVKPSLGTLGTELAVEGQESLGKISVLSAAFTRLDAQNQKK